MLRLIKLAVYTLVGYALYEFVRGMMDNAPSGSSPGSEASSGSGASQSPPAAAGGSTQPQSPIGQTAQPALSSSSEPQSPLMGGSSAPQGIRVPTQDFDGASITETVGRGVIPQR